MIREMVLQLGILEVGRNYALHSRVGLLVETTLVMMLFGTISVIAFAREEPARDSSAGWDNLVDQFFAGYLSVHPSLGTYAGFHQYDSELEDYSQRGVDNEVIFANRYLERFEKFASNLLSAEQEQDRQFVISQIRARLLESRSIREWEKNPDVYSSGITQSAFGIMSRKFAPTIRERVDDPADEAAKRCERC